MTARISLNLGRTCNFGAFAAERRKNVAPGASPGFVLMSNSAPEGRKTRRIFRPSGAGRLPTNYPGLAPGATFLSRSAAGTAASAITKNGQSPAGGPRSASAIARSLKNRPPLQRKPDAGFSLAALIVFLTAASILMAAAVPAYQTQAKREREEELIFRGEEYMRAIQKYQRKFGIYPPSVDALVETNGLRFVRRPYKDPITGKDFRLISINPDGSINGSIATGQGNNVPLFGDVQRFGAGTGQQQQSGLFQQQQQPQAGSETTRQATQQLPSSQQQQQQQQSGFSQQQGVNRTGGVTSPTQLSQQP